MSKPACPDCGGKQHVYQPDTDRWVRCVCLEKRILLEHAKARGVPDGCANYRIDSLLGNTTGLRTLKTWIEGVDRGVRTGTIAGLACLLGSARQVRFVGGILVLYAPSGLFARVDDLTVSMMRDPNRKLYQTSRNVTLLAVAVGHEAPNAFDRGTLDGLLDERDDGKKLTLVLASRTPNELAERYGTRPLWGQPVYIPAEDFGHQETTASAGTGGKERP